MFDDDDYNPLEADREYVHEIARDHGTSPSGEPLPRHTEGHGRVWVTCNCGSKFLLKPSPRADLSDLEDEVADAILMLSTTRIGSSHWRISGGSDVVALYVTPA